MLNLHDPKQAYETFRLKWMIDHGYGILDLIKNLESMIEEDQNESGVRTSLSSLFQDWELGIRFDGTIWPCYQEFLEHDYPMMLKTINTYEEKSRITMFAKKKRIDIYGTLEYPLAIGCAAFIKKQEGDPIRTSSVKHFITLPSGVTYIQTKNTH